MRVVQVCCYGIRVIKEDPDVEMEDEEHSPKEAEDIVDPDEIRSGDSGEEFDPTRKTIGQQPNLQVES